MKNRVYILFIFTALTVACTSTKFTEPENQNLVKANFGWLAAKDRQIEDIANREGNAAIEASQRYFGFTPNPFIILDKGVSLDVSEPHATPIYFWDFKEEIGQSDFAYLHNTTLRHEIGHDLFIKNIYPDKDGSQYGGDAPDWLDEGAAILFESEEQTKSRRLLAKKLALNGDLIPMAMFLSMTHPQWQPNTSRLFEESDNKSGIVVPLSSLGNAQQTRVFYLQCRAFIDYLIDRTGDEKLLLSVSERLREGASIQDWLAEQTELPNDIVALEDDFFVWARARSIS